MEPQKKVRQEIAEKLQDFLATTYALYLKTQNFHWNVKGPEFFSLHLLFQKQYEEMAEAVDEIAERIQALGVTAEGSFQAFQKRSRIPDAKKTGSIPTLLNELIKGHETIAAMGRPWIAMFQSFHDDVTSDLLIKRLAFHEKAVWMLESLLS